MPFASAMKDESFRVRLGALRGLYKFGGESATEYLITALEDKHQDVRRRAIIYLGMDEKDMRYSPLLLLHLRTTQPVLGRLLPTPWAM